MTTTSPYTGGVGNIEVFGIDDNGARGYFPNSQTFTISSSQLDFSSNIESISGGTCTPAGDGTWTINPNPGSVYVQILFRSSVTGTYTVVSNGPVTGQNGGGTVHPRA
ncbi:Uncharacterised protein [Acidipropionibacterium jensenii]|uniref:Uncharacterized protein n=1 Tax=Acidipropionibacterium jensenii TaxID=1749 RepID=A0A3S4YNR8_9ACTN|nr:hypothetical protein [Acidipropionibacterium jensenii]VEI02996.1 Uncharacterised protein [Acidipropionibacterium jensenii]